MLRIGLIIVVAMCLAACAGPQVISSHPKSATYEASFDDVWEKAIRFVSTNQINVETIEKDSGLLVIGAETIDAPTIQGLCDTDAVKPMLNSLMGGSGKGNITVVEEGGFVTATINLTYSALFMYSMNGQQSVQRCSSTGKYEESFLQALK